MPDEMPSWEPELRAQVDRCRQAARAGAEEVLVALLDALTALGDGRMTEERGKAVGPTGEAVEVARRLFAADPRHRVRLVEALTSQYVALTLAGQFEDAIVAAEDLIAQLHLLAPGDLPDVDARLAEAVGELGVLHGNVGRYVPAAGFAAESARRYADLGPARVVSFGRTLLELCAAVDAGGEAAAAELEAEVGETLARFQPDDRVFEMIPEVGAALNGLAAALNAAGRSSDALPAVTTSIEMLRRLSAANQLHYKDYASALSTLVHVHGGLHDDARQLEVARENVELLRQWTTAHWELFPERLAPALDDLAAVLTRLGRTEEARSVMNEAADRYEHMSHLGHYWKLTQLRRAGSLQSE
ncbi:hypothetical protein FKR81_02755 [Lentzea tibetensis]|uniref:Tetratricopeptide repeat protein n=1 Tax=Lentzea tibetensis TaxID=2591470 RepID=A0A563F145_9PSEU|nr:hypothetical protein [Lentzea tibetensis]TWP53695.1 hypothetical protein FKR81_02755 [Lentzea tibetensis]